MKRLGLSLVCLVVICPAHSVCGDEKEPKLTSYHKAIDGLDEKKIHAGLPSVKLLELCVPSSRRTVGRFTELDYELYPGYHGLAIIAKDGLLKRAVVWSCTYTSTYFDEMTSEDREQYTKAYKDNANVPPERLTERWGWERPRMRDWQREETKAGGARQR